MSCDVDIAIIGGGLVGSSAACALADSGKSVALIDAKALTPLPAHVSRPISLSYASHCVLKHLGIWQDLSDHATPIKMVHTSDQGHFGAFRIRASEMQVDALGYVVPLHHLYNALLAKLQTLTNTQYLTETTVEHLRYIENGIELTFNNKKTLTANLVIAADGTHSKIRELLHIDVTPYDSGQHAVVCQLDAKHDYTAFERFHQQGTLALLPMGKIKMGVVWVSKEPESLMSLDDEAFINHLHQHFGYRIGQFTGLTARYQQPLSCLIAKEQIRPHCVLLGNAAHTLYPIAAQGFNLSLSDTAMLVDVVKQDLPLQTYIEKRLPYQKSIAFCSNSLAGLFHHESHAVTGLRHLGLAAFDMLPPLKKAFAKLAMGTL